MHAVEYDPGDPESIWKAFSHSAAKGFANIMDIPQDVIRPELLNPSYDFISLSDDVPPLMVEINKKAQEILDLLEPQEKQLMILLFGLNDGQQRTTAEAAKILGITMDEVKELEAKCFMKLSKISKNTTFNVDLEGN